LVDYPAAVIEKVVGGGTIDLKRPRRGTKQMAASLVTWEVAEATRN